MSGYDQRAVITGYFFLGFLPTIEPAYYLPNDANTQYCPFAVTLLIKTEIYLSIVVLADTGKH